MPDNKNNKTGALGPDGWDDVTGEKVAPAAPQTFTAPGPMTIDSITTEQAVLDASVAQAVAAAASQLGVNQQKASSTPAEFQVNVGLPRSQNDGVSMTAGLSPYSTVHYGLDSALSAGFLGIKDPRLISLVQQAADGKIDMVDDVYKSAVAQAAYYQKMGKNITVVDILKNPEQYKIGKYNPSAGGGYTGPVTTRSRSVALTNRSAAHALLNTTLSAYLGREATQEETNKFLKALNVQERANPTMSTTVQDMNDEGSLQTVSSKTTGGFSREDFADRFAKSQEGYAEYQASTTYLDAFIGALENKSRVI